MDQKLEKSPLQSKKFIAVMIWSLIWLFLIGYGIKMNIEGEVLLAMIYTNGMVQGLFLGGQSFVDMFVRQALVRNGAGSPSSPIQVEVKPR